MGACVFTFSAHPPHASLSLHGQGYLRLSVAVIGPGDKLKVHDASELSSLTADIPRAGAGASPVGSAASLQLLIPPTVKQDLRFLVITLHKVRGC